jgi:hypothetical protein
MKKHIAGLKSELKKAKDEVEESRKSAEEKVTDNPTPVPPVSSSIDKKVKPDIRFDKTLTLDKAKRQIQILTEQNERLKRELNIASQTEEGLMREMENTTRAVEDLMNQVG